MATVQEIVGRQKEDAQFVIFAQMLRIPLEEFAALAQQWIAADGADGFVLVGVPHRRVTAVRTA